jgi:alanyl-tRNA synthetase
MLNDGLGHALEKWLFKTGATHITAEEALKLYDTFGLSVDVTSRFALEKGVTVDVAGFESLLQQQKQHEVAHLDVHDSSSPRSSSTGGRYDSCVTQTENLMVVFFFA